MRIINVKTNSYSNYSLFENNSEIGNLAYKDQKLSFAIYKTQASDYFVINESSFFKKEFKIIQNQKDLFKIKINLNHFFKITDLQNEKIFTFDNGSLFKKGQSLSCNGEEIININYNFNWRKFKTEYTISSKLNDCDDILFFIAIYCKTYYNLFLTD